jgi:Tfp pilus assembly protein PilF
MARGLLLTGLAAAMSAQSLPPGVAAQPRNGSPVASSGAAVDIVQLLQAGADALNGGRLDEAERDFRQVLAANPQVGGAYANLGVVYMKRKQWTKALGPLHKA